MTVRTINTTTDQEPATTLPKWVREAAKTRGFGDAAEPLSLFVTAEDKAIAFAEAAQGNGAACVMAQAGRRLGAKHVYFYRSTAWVDFGSGPIVRYVTSSEIYRNVISPFDDGDQEAVMPGVYHLLPPSPGMQLPTVRDETTKKRHRQGYKTGTAPNRSTAHMGRVVLGARADE